MKKWTHALAALVLVLASAFHGIARGADPQGRFAIKGIGTTDCATYVTQADLRGNNAFMYGGWVYGFLTATNKWSPDTFDLVSWEDLETLTTYLYGYCRENPEMRFAQAVFQLSEALHEDRVTEALTPVEARVGDDSVVIYPSALTRAQSRLHAVGYLQVDANGVFDENTEAALRSYQKAQGLKETGLPDQATLHRLLRQQ